VDARLLVGALLERGQPGRAHQARLLQPRDLLHVDLAPVAAGLARSEALHVAIRVDGVGPGVDPSEAERLVDRLGPGHRTLARMRLEEADVDLGLGLVMLLEPVVELLRRLEEDRLRLAHTGITPCFLRGRSTRFVAAISSARITRGRVSRGSMMSSISA